MLTFDKASCGTLYLSLVLDSGTEDVSTFARKSLDAIRSTGMYPGSPSPVRALDNAVQVDIHAPGDAALQRQIYLLVGRVGLVFTLAEVASAPASCEKELEIVAAQTSLLGPAVPVPGSNPSVEEEP